MNKYLAYLVGCFFVLFAIQQWPYPNLVFSLKLNPVRCQRLEIMYPVDQMLFQKGYVIKSTPLTKTKGMQETSFSLASIPAYVQILGCKSGDKISVRDMELLLPDRSKMDNFGVKNWNCVNCNLVPERDNSVTLSAESDGIIYLAPTASVLTEFTSSFVNIKRVVLNLLSLFTILFLLVPLSSIIVPLKRSITIIEAFIYAVLLVLFNYFWLRPRLVPFFAPSRIGLGHTVGYAQYYGYSTIIDLVYFASFLLAPAIAVVIVYFRRKLWKKR